MKHVLAGIAAIVIAGAGLYVAMSPDMHAPFTSSSAEEPVRPASSAARRSAPGPCGHDALADVRRIVASQLGINVSDVVDGRPLAQQRNAADDLDFVEIVMTIEEKCGVEIGDAELPGKDDKTTVERLSRLVNSKR